MRDQFEDQPQTLLLEKEEELTHDSITKKELLKEH